ncbi:hypothetical protein [Neotabrizicola sp. VNH66]|uniref:hypothetical protein n=1 Tax=Neotabrizicola sp. VNH66 TaxID=3400918 RepID=UPI003BFA978A
MSSKRKRKRDNGKAGADQFALAKIPPREKSGRAYRPREHRDPATETLKTRCRHMGKPITNANLRDQRAPWWGCYAGRVIGDAMIAEHERQELWAAITHMRKVVTVFDAAIGAPRRHAVCLRLLAPSEVLHADASTPAPDERDPATKQRQATAALSDLERWLGEGDKFAAGMTKRVVWDDVICTDPAGLIETLRNVVWGMRGKKFPRR